MTHIEQLIKDLCPNGVEWKTIGEIADIRTGKGITQSDAAEGGEYPIISGGIGPMGYYHIKNRDANTITVSRVGANAGFVNFITEDFYLNDKCFSVIPNKTHASLFNLRFLYFYLKKVENSIRDMQSEGGVPTINTQKVGSLDIPIPPMEIQERIVALLDRYSALAAELQAELQLRRKQYEHYRTRLLTPHSDADSADKSDDCNWVWKTLGEIGTFQRGNGLQKKDFTEEGTGCIHYGQIYTKLGTFCHEPITRVPDELAAKLAKVYPGNLVIACTSENVEDCCKAVAWLGEETIVTGGHAAVFRHNENPKYMAYAFQSEIFQTQKNKFAKGVKVIDIKIDELAKIKIPLPSLEEQARIVEILDKFEALTTSLSEGIPAEQAAQQKRYEYFRDLLLTFDRKQV